MAKLQPRIFLVDDVSSGHDLISDGPRKILIIKMGPGAKGLRSTALGYQSLCPAVPSLAHSVLFCCKSHSTLSLMYFTTLLCTVGKNVFFMALSVTGGNAFHSTLL